MAQLFGDLKKTKGAKRRRLNNQYSANLTRRLDVAFFVRVIFAAFLMVRMVRVLKMTYFASFI